MTKECMHGVDMDTHCEKCGPESLPKAPTNFLLEAHKENTLAGGISNWYTLDVLSTQGKENYTAVCDDIILALNMNFQEGEVFKAVWRKAAARMGNGKPGNTALYNAQKILHYGKILELSENPLVKGNE